MCIRDSDLGLAHADDSRSTPEFMSSDSRMSRSSAMSARRPSARHPQGPHRGLPWPSPPVPVLENGWCILETRWLEP
eukprot:15447080-Alexandrium_andersonii.AAC.1